MLGRYVKAVGRHLKVLGRCLKVSGSNINTNLLNADIFGAYVNWLGSKN